MARARVLTRESLAAGAAKKWGEAYQKENEREEIHRRLRALGPCPEPDDVDRVIGRDYWTRLDCVGCDDSSGPWVVVGEEGFDSVTLCKACLCAALEALKAEEGDVLTEEPVITISDLPKRKPRAVIALDLLDVDEDEPA